MRANPLIFKISHVVHTERFAAHVVGCGRFLMALEDGEWWANGVQPGPIAGGGETPALAFEDFQVRFRKVLEDFANESESCQEFEERATRFFGQVDIDGEQVWSAAAEELNHGGELEPPFRDLPTFEDEFRDEVTVEDLEGFVHTEGYLALPPKAA